MDGRISLVLACSLVVGAAVAPQAPPRGESTPGGPARRADPRPPAEYRAMDNVVGARVELNVPAVRPLALGPGSETLYAVNTHDSTIEAFDVATGSASGVFPVPWGPTSVVYWERQPQPDELLVVCRGSYAFLRLDAATGEVRHLVELVDADGRVQAEPGDLLFDPVSQRAFVSCAATDSVVQVDVAANAVERVYSERHGDAAMRLKNPLFLSFDAGGRVLVAPLTSGNGTLSEPDGTGDAPGIVVDTAGWFEPLPDEDLFRIDPGAGTVEVVARRTAAVLFAHGTNPLTGQLWQLGTDAHNADPAMQTEAAVRGRFATNRLTITQPSSGPPASNHLEIDLDALAAGEDDRILAQPYALAFLRQAPQAGVGLVTGLLSDTVVALAPSGAAIVGSWRLEDGSIPRGLAVTGDETRAFVHCWGTNRVARIDLTVPGSTPTYHDLRHDPTPPDMRRGRELFYDAHNSLDSNVSCATCHVEGRSDMLVWNLSDPGDDKGPLVTQPLVKLDRIGRLHWRGERELRSFNKAFDTLLGGAPLDAMPGGDIERLEAFLRSIQNPANPNQSKHRLIDDGERPPGLPSTDVSARDGQRHFFETKTFRANLSTGAGYACSECHALPVGAMGDTFVLKWANFPRRGQRKIPPLVGLWRKAQSAVVARAEATDPPQEHAFLGAGMSHNGRVRDLRAFVSGVGVTDSVQVEDDITAFLHQLDEGLAPAVHRALLLGPGTVDDGSTAGEIGGYLLGQARRRYCDVVAFGSVDLGAGPQPARWVYDDGADVFRGDSAAIVPRPFAFFVDQARAGHGQVFLGLPHGMGERFAVDHDLDGKLNRDEPGAEYVPDPAPEGTPPVFTVEPTVHWVTAREARIGWETDEPTRYQLVYGEPGSPNRTVSSPHYARAHAGLIVQLRPSPAVDPTNPTGPVPPPAHFDVSVRAIDRHGNTRMFALDDGITTKPFLRDKIFEPLEPGGPLVEDLETEQGLVLGSLEWLEADDASVPGTLLARVRAKVLYQAGEPLVPAPLRTVVASVLIGRAGSQELEISTNFVTGPGAFRFNGVSAVTGPDRAYLTPSAEPLLVTLESDDEGIVEFELRQPGLSPGDRVIVNVESVAAVDPAELARFHDNLADPTGELEVPVVSQRYAWTRWSFPDSKVRLETCFRSACD